VLSHGSHRRFSGRQGLTHLLLSPRALHGWRLVSWAAAFGVGAYAGYRISVSVTGPSSWGVFGVAVAGMFWVVWTVAFIAIPGLVATFLYRALSKGRLPEARTVIAFAALYTGGVGVGFVSTPVFGLDYRYHEPVTLKARATMTLALEGIAGYSARGDGLAECMSEPDGEDVSWVAAIAIGTIDGVDVRAVVSNVDFEASFVTVSVQPTAGSKFQSWSGPVEFADRTLGDRNARITFVEAVREASEAGGPAQRDWPAALSGTLTWSCGDWIGPEATFEAEP